MENTLRLLIEKAFTAGPAAAKQQERMRTTRMILVFKNLCPLLLTPNQMQKRQILYQVNYSVQKRLLMFGFSLVEKVGLGLLGLPYITILIY